jgi:hypothetical protein
MKAEAYLGHGRQGTCHGRHWQGAPFGLALSSLHNLIGLIRLDINILEITCLEDGGDTFLRNVGSNQSDTVLHPRKRYSSQSYLYCVPGWRRRYSDWLRAGRLRGRGSSPGRVKNVHFSMFSRPALESTQPPTQWVPGALSPGVKRPGHEAGHSPPTSAELILFY